MSKDSRILGKMCFSPKIIFCTILLYSYTVIHVYLYNYTDTDDTDTCVYYVQYDLLHKCIIDVFIYMYMSVCTCVCVCVYVGVHLCVCVCGALECFGHARLPFRNLSPVCWTVFGQDSFL